MEKTASLGLSNRARLSREKAKEFSEKVVALCEEFQAADELEGGVKYQLTLLLFPLAKTQRKSPEEEKEGDLYEVGNR
jgi:hypothetical protein